MHQTTHTANSKPRESRHGGSGEELRDAGQKVPGSSGPVPPTEDTTVCPRLMTPPDPISDSCVYEEPTRH